MKLLFDENLSPKLPEALSAEYPGSTHVRTVGLLGAEDQRIWDYSREHGYTIVSKDTDFRERGRIILPDIVAGWTFAVTLFFSKLDQALATR